MYENSFENYIDHRLIWVRFKTLEELKDKINEDLKSLKEENLKVKDIGYVTDYESDYQDWEIIVIIENEKEESYDVSLYYAKTRIREKVIVESSFEKL